jgi:hypothetical protein
MVFSRHLPINVQFCSKDSRLLRITELVSSSTKGRLSVCSRLFTFHLNQSLKRVHQRQLKIASLPRCHSYSPDEQILLLGCVDASIVAWDQTRDTVAIYRSAFVICIFNYFIFTNFYFIFGDFRFRFI